MVLTSVSRRLSKQPSTAASSKSSRRNSTPASTRGTSNASSSRTAISSSAHYATHTIPMSMVPYTPGVARYCPHCTNPAPANPNCNYCIHCNSPLTPYPRPSPSINPPSTVASAVRPTPTISTRRLSTVPPSSGSPTVTSPTSTLSSVRTTASDPNAKYHPAGRQAWVYPDGTPTRKLEAFRDAITAFLFNQCPSGSGMLDMSRMYYFEWAWGRKDWLTLFNGDTTQRVYNELGYEYALVLTRHPTDPNISERTPALSPTGLLSFLTHELLLSPSLSAQRLRHLLSHHGNKIPGPPPSLGIGSTWEVADHMLLRQPHPDAIRKQRRLVLMMRGLGWEFSNAAQWGV